MTSKLSDIIMSIEWYHVILFFCVVILLLLLQMFIQVMWHRFSHRLIWPAYEGLELQKDLDESETVRHILLKANQHSVKRNTRTSVIRGIHWDIYISLKLMRRKLSKVPAEIITMIPASLWLFENFHFIYRELKKFQETGGANRFKDLPGISHGKSKRYPRVYALAREIISCNHHLSSGLLLRLLKEYQRKQELTTAELWTFHNAITLCLLEEIVLESKKVLSAIAKKQEAERKLKKIVPLIVKREVRLADLLNSVLSDEQKQDNVFIAHIIHRLRGLPVDDGELTSWLDSIFNQENTVNVDWLSLVVNRESQFEAASEASISTLITSLKAIGSLNWTEIFHRVSKLDSVLTKDPSDVYRNMDEKSKAQYRLIIEKLAKKCHLAETVIAEKALELAVQNESDGKIRAGSHIGYYLIKKGYYDLLSELSFSASFRRFADRVVRPVRGFFYFAGILGITAGVLLALHFYLFEITGVQFYVRIVIYLLLIIPVSDMAIFLINNIFTRLVKPQPLISLDLTESVPPEFCTYVVMPVILNSPEQIKSYVERLEKHYLCNRQDNLYFAILADFADADSETVPADAAILKAGISAVNKLNDTYTAATPRFQLYFRQRKWNEAENCWMGWERKRGKLEVFNSFLCGEKSADIDLVAGAYDQMPDIHYVITLDADTELLRNGAAELIGIMAHPLNKPVIDQKSKRIKEGYVIVQSEIRTRISTHSSSHFARYFSGQAGIDPYSTIASDVYQDLFDEGIYAGKGIYDLRIFNKFLAGAISENSVLSHDLLEGSLSRCAFASGIKLMDSCPATVLGFTRREHRWIRGDWQLLPWFVSGSGINGLSRWKILDNLRRSITRPASLLLLIGNAILMPANIWISLLVIGFEPVFRIVSLLLGVLLQKMLSPTSRFSLLVIAEKLSSILIQNIFSLVILPLRSFLAIDAIVRTIYRLFYSHRNLLEWQTAESVEKSLQNRLVFYIKSMWMSAVPALAVVSAAISVFYSGSFWFWLSLAMLWILSPWLAWLSSQKSKVLKISEDEDTRQLRLTARKTWAYFENYSAIDNHWLCPDNVQIYPGPRISNKTSPTNIGLQLLSLMSAWDMGYTGLNSLIETSDNIFDTILSLPKWNGHLYNWYNIRTLQVLNPRYISTVDSGNFITHLIAFKQGLIQLKTKRAISADIFKGLMDTMELAGMSNVILSDFVDNNEKTMADWISCLETIIEEAGCDSDDLPDGKMEIQSESDLKDNPWRAKVCETCQSFLTDVLKLNLNGKICKAGSLNEYAETGNVEAINMVGRINNLIEVIVEIVDKTDFRILYDSEYQLFSIGYNETSQSIDSGHYDLLASESRTASFFAIARGEIPQKHWFVLGRPLTMVRNIPTCVSWSGSMFEYLMPGLVMKEPEGSVLQQSCLASVLYQISYARKHNIPWGISESQYYRFDTNSNYQYGPAGVQRLRLQASLKPAKVVAPYATILALSILPRQSMDNLARMRELGAEGEFGFYESLDYDHPDAGRLENFSLVKCFMAHHQGMSLVSINNFFNNNIMQYRFHKEPAIGAAEALLEEKNSNNLITLASRGYTINIDVSNLEEEIIESRVCSKTNLIQPLAHVLSNNHYMLMLTSDGAGFSTCDNVMINRWQPETIHEQKGSFIYIHNLNLHQFWSASYLPTQKIPDDYKAIFSHDKAEFIRRDGLIRTHTSITVSPLKNIEIRRIVMYNHGDHPVDIELTSYLEVVADDLRSDEMHPAFSKLFIETEYVADRNLLIANRRARSPEDKPRYIIHSILPETKLMRQVEYEIDRRNFIGRGGSLQNPAMIDRSMPMSNQAGFSRDTILSLRAVVVIPAGGKASVSFVTGFCSSKAETMALSYDLKKPYSASDIFKLALVSSKLELKYLKIDSRRLNAIQNLVSYLYYPDLSTRSLAKNTSQLVLGQHGLWRYGISGDYPIILLLAGHLKEIPIIQDVLLAYEYLRVNQVRADLVIINEEPHGYTQDLEQRLREMTGNLKIFSYDESKPSLFLLRKSHMQENEYNLLLAVSRLVLNGRNGLYGPELNQYPQSQKYTAAENQKAILLPAGSKLYKPADKNYYDNGLDNLEFFNGIGGFGDDGREYEIRLNDGQKTPMPWINVISNEKFGFLVSETGAGYTWSDNSRENKLTVWSNDPVLDPISEAVYIKDDISGGITSPSSLVPAQAGNYRIRHGFGYSIFDHYELNLNQQMTMFVPVNDSVKIWLLKIENHDESIRTLTVTFSIEWVLGVVRSQSAPFIRTDWHGDSELLTARNLYNDKYRYRPAYVFSSEPVVSFSSDRKIFYGTGGSARLPYGLMQQLDQSAGNGLDPCSVIQVKIILEPGQNREIVFGMGQAGTYEEAVKISKSYRRLDHTKNALADVKHKWAGILRTVTIKTPDRAMDIMANGWLQYQVISCRLQARAAFYQCGGAIGFRDQLQDVLSLMNVDSDIVRRQILICCSRQFVEGDVQHWWHKDSGLGVRTRITDDLLWLPYVTAEYVTQTGDSGILDEKVAFITGDALADDQAERMVQPQVSEQMGTVYQHCLLAIQKSDGIGTHGLPLMGGGDWNDGMNRVGIGGKGESVWLGWFLYTVIQRFIPLACNYNDIAACQRLTEQANDLQRNLDLHAWDGEWYLRAFFDNGTPLGSKVSDECRIDSISQSWSVLSEAGGQLRSLTALDSAKRYLVHEEDGLSLLLTPPFNKTPNDPGYIKGYYPGMRENGGQYTHAAIWLAMAHAKVGKSNDAYQLLTLLNPIHATSSISSVSKYEKEPYVMSADISTGGSYTGKAGWSWYTGSAGWMHQAIMQSFLGLNKNGDMLSVSPSVPISFKRYVIEYRYGTALYEITVLNEPVSADKLNCLYIDGQISEGNSFQLIDDGNVHNIEYHYTGSS